MAITIILMINILALIIALCGNPLEIEIQAISHHSTHFLAVQLFQTEIFGDYRLRNFTFE